MLEELIEHKKIRDKKKEVDVKTDSVKFTITGFKGDNFACFHLVKCYAMSNMVLLDNDNRPKRYDSVKEIIEEFYEKRLVYYHKRKELLLSRLKEKVDFDAEKINFIEAVNNGGVIVLKRNKKDVKADLVQLGLNVDLYDKIKTYEYSTDELEALKESFSKLVEEKERLEQLDAKQMWLDDILRFEDYFKKTFPKDSVEINVNEEV